MERINLSLKGGPLDGEVRTVEIPVIVLLSEDEKDRIRKDELPPGVYAEYDYRRTGEFNIDGDEIAVFIAQRTIPQKET